MSFLDNLKKLAFGQGRRNSRNSRSGWPSSPPVKARGVLSRGAYCALAHDPVRLLAGRVRSARQLAVGTLEWWLAHLPVAR
jgi:hypothetical protein